MLLHWINTFWLLVGLQLRTRDRKSWMHVSSWTRHVTCCLMRRPRTLAWSARPRSLTTPSSDWPWVFMTVLGGPYTTFFLRRLGHVEPRDHVPRVAGDFEPWDHDTLLISVIRFFRFCGLYIRKLSICVVWKIFARNICLLGLSDLYIERKLYVTPSSMIETEDFKSP